MNSYAKLIAPVFLAVVVTTACQSGPKFSDVANKDWNLVKVHINSKDIDFDRNILKEEGFGEIFTLRFDDGEKRVNGVAAPNRYFSPYTLADKQEITIGAVAGTLMASINQPEKLKEQDYFTYLQNTYKWNLGGGNLELHSKTGDGADVVLFFITAGKK